MKTYQEGPALILSKVGVPAYAEMVRLFGEKMADEIAVRWTTYDRMTSGSRDRGSNKSNAFALRVARQNGDEAMVLAMILRKRRGYHAEAITTQRRWQTNVSRRTGRQRHHDSGEIRERYVRAAA